MLNLIPHWRQPLIWPHSDLYHTSLRVASMCSCSTPDISRFVCAFLLLHTYRNSWRAGRDISCSSSSSKGFSKVCVFQSVRDDTKSYSRKSMAENYDRAERCWLKQNYNTQPVSYQKERSDNILTHILSVFTLHVISFKSKSNLAGFLHSDTL